MEHMVHPPLAAEGAHGQSVTWALANNKKLQAGPRQAEIQAEIQADYAIMRYAQCADKNKDILHLASC